MKESTFAFFAVAGPLRVPDQHILKWKKTNPQLTSSGGRCLEFIFLLRKSERDGFVLNCRPMTNDRSANQPINQSIV